MGAILQREAPERTDDWVLLLRRMPPERVEARGCAGDFGGEFLLRRTPLKGENDGVVQGGQMGGKVAEIEFFEVGNHAKNGHLSKDKRTKFSDKWFVLFQTFTSCDPV